MAKKKIKKFLKSVAPLAIAGLGAAMLGNRRNRKNQMKQFLATEGGDLANANQIGRAIEMRDDNTAVLAPRGGFDYLDLPFKKGGRVKKRKGFAKKKKQANKMRKK